MEICLDEYIYDGEMTFWNLRSISSFRDSSEKVSERLQKRKSAVAGEKDEENFSYVEGVT